MRLFVACPLSRELVAILERTQTRLLRSIPDGIALSNLLQLHLTLIFLGERPPEELPKWKSVVQLAAQVIPGVFPLHLNGFGAFPHRSDPRVIWAGINDPSGYLKAIAATLRNEAQVLGCPVEEREFAPHLTLARNKVARNSTSLRLFLEREKVPEFKEEVEEIVLFESTPTDGGHRHSAVFRAPLGPTK